MADLGVAIVNDSDEGDEEGGLCSCLNTLAKRDWMTRRERIRVRLESHWRRKQRMIGSITLTESASTAVSSAR